MASNRSSVSLFADPTSVKKAIVEISNLQRQANDANDKQQMRLFAAAKQRLSGMKAAYVDLVKTVKKSFDEINSATKKSADIAADATRKSVSARVSAEQNAAKQITSIQQKNIDAFEKAEKAKTRAYLRQVAQRSEADRRASREGGAGTSGGRGGGRYSSTSGSISFSPFQAGRQFATDIHGQIQDARQRRAGTSRNMSNAFFQAGANATEAAELRASTYGFARANNLDSSVLASALTAAQTEFSVLAPNAQQRSNGMSDSAARRQNLGQYLQFARFARNTGQDQGEVMRVAGMLSQAGITGQAQRDTMLALTGMAQQGAIELGAVTRTALGPLQGRMATAVARLGPGATAEQRAQAQRQAVVQSFAEMEVGKALGLNPRMMGNNMRNLEGALTSPLVQDRILDNINHSRMTEAQRRQARNALFDRGRDGRMHLKTNVASSPYEFARALQTGFSGNSELMSNVLGGGGRGNPQSLQRNWRNMLALMMGGGGAGTENDRIAALMRGMGTDFTEADVTRGESIFANDEQAQLTRDQENRDTALTDNTSEIVKLSNQFASFTANNPFGVAAMTAIGGAFGGGFLSRIGTFNFGMGGVGAGAGGGMLGGGGGAAGGAAGGLLMRAGSLTGLGVGGGVLVAGALAGAAVLDATRRGSGLDASTAINQAMMTPEQQRAQEQGTMRSFDAIERNRRSALNTAVLGPVADGPVADLSVPNIRTTAATQPIELGPQSMQALLSFANRPVDIDPHAAEFVIGANNTAANTRR